MTNRDYTRQIEFVLASKLPDEVCSVRDILKRSRPSAAAVAETPVFDIPRRNARVGQCRSHGPHILHRYGTLVQIGQLRNPAATMNYDRERVPPLFRRQPQLTELEWIRSIGNAPRAGRNRLGCEFHRTSRLRARRAGDKEQ